MLTKKFGRDRKIFKLLIIHKEAILDNLSELGNVPQSLIDCINKQDNLDVLKSWTKIAVMAESLDEFEEENENLIK